VIVASVMARFHVVTDTPLLGSTPTTPGYQIVIPRNKVVTRSRVSTKWHR
jgi:hypothetical protein